MSGYRVVPGPLYTPPVLARAHRHERVEDAVAVMGHGIVLDGTRLVAFHESHLSMIERMHR